MKWVVIIGTFILAITTPWVIPIAVIVSLAIGIKEMLKK